MKKYLFMMAVAITTIATCLVSCKDDDDSPKIKPGYASGEGTITLDGTTYPITDLQIRHDIPWGDPYGFYIIDLTGGEESDGIYATIVLVGKYLNNTYSLKDNLNSDDNKYLTYLYFNNGIAYYTSDGDFKKGTIRMDIDDDGNIEIETEGVANSQYDTTDPDFGFSISYKGKANVNDVSYAEPPHVPYGDGLFTGTADLVINGVTKTVESVEMYYSEGPTGSYNIYFRTSDYIYFCVTMPLDHIGKTYKLTDDLTGKNYTYAYIAYDGDTYNIYYTDEKDFKSGTVKINIDKDGNMELYTKGVGNDSDNDTDPDFEFEASFKGKGTVYK